MTSTTSAPPTSRPADQPRTLYSDAMASAAVALFSAAVAAGYARVFAGWEFFDNMLVLVVLGHGVGLVLRRLRVPGWIAVPALAAVLVWAIGAIHYRFTYSFLLPTSETYDLFRSELGLVQDQFRTAVAPVLYGGGWDVLAAIGLVAAIVLADTFAFRAYARAEALVPGGVLFVFIAALGADRLRVSLTVALVAAGVVTTVVLRTYHAPRPMTTTGTVRRNPIRLVLPAAVATALVVALVAGLIGPRLPGANAEPLYDTRGRGTGSVTEIVSPLVDIRSRLTNRSNSELFVVQANFASYWRSSALPQFDGTTWGLPERRLTTADGSLTAPRPGTETLRQQVRIVALGGSLVPAAADPVQASPSENLRWSEDTATLIKTDEDLTAGDTFEIVSASPRYDSATLSAATSTDAGDPIYLELPDDWPESVAQTAAEVTAGAESPYEAALALQNWFRDPNEWSYSLEVQSGHGTNAIEAFLRERVGYCEQFAGTYAAMMRSLGYPARVAVGFTPGTARGDGSFSVLGKNAHAWPEVWFDGLGWVPFEPTPGRGSPGAEEYTGFEAEQDDSGVDPDAPRAEADESVVPTTIPGGPNNQQEPPLNIPAEDFLDPGAADPAGVPVVEERGDGFNWTVAVLVLGAIAALLAPAVVRRWRRRTTAQSTDTQLAHLWQRSLDSLSDVGVVPDPSQTPMELAAVTARQFPIVARPMSELAEVMTDATYSPDGSAGYTETGQYGNSTLRSCSHWTRQIDRAVRDSVGLGARVKRYFTRWR